MDDGAVSIDDAERLVQREPNRGGGLDRRARWEHLVPQPEDLEDPRRAHAIEALVDLADLAPDRADVLDAEHALVLEAAEQTGVFSHPCQQLRRGRQILVDARQDADLGARRPHEAALPNVLCPRLVRADQLQRGLCHRPLSSGGR